MPFPNGKKQRSVSIPPGNQVLSVMLSLISYNIIKEVSKIEILAENRRKTATGIISERQGISK